VLGSPGSPAQPVALPHCVCEWERGTPNAPRTPTPYEPFRGQARGDGAGPGPSPMPTLSWPKHASIKPVACRRQSDRPPLPRGDSAQPAARHTGKVTGGEQTKRWGVLESGDTSKVHPPRELVLRPHCVEGQRHGRPVVSCRQGTARGTGEVVTQP
jgi:hypothetical protein